MLFILNECPYQVLSKNVREWARLRPSRNRDSRTHNNLTIPHHLHGKVTLLVQPKPTQKLQLHGKFYFSYLLRC